MRALRNAVPSFATKKDGAGSSSRDDKPAPSLQSAAQFRVLKRRNLSAPLAFRYVIL
jgi:hypothetical protein